MIGLILHDFNRFDRENQGINLGPSEELCRDTFGRLGVDYEKDVWLSTARSFFEQGQRPPVPLSKIIFAGANNLKWLSIANGKTLDSFRGVVHRSGGGTPYIATYWPQDACDLRAVEAELQAAEESDEVLDTDGDAKSTSPTKRSNYRFWFNRDVEKLLTLTTIEPPAAKEFYAETSEQALAIFSYEGPIFLDIECDPKTNTLLCIALAVGNSPVVSVPVYDWNSNLRCGPAFFARLVREMKRRRVVIHNALFDLLFMALHYGIPFGTDIFCTMCAGHRIWPEAEKSLAHQQTLYTNRAFHKDEGGTFQPRNRAQYDTLRRYNVKDVIALREIYYGQLAYAAKDPGLSASVEQVAAEQADAAFMSIHGMPFNFLKRNNLVRQCEARHADLKRVLRMLVGYDLNAGSPDQVAKYLHVQLGYSPEKTTEKGAASVAGDALYKIKIKHPKNVAIDVILEMRRMVKLKGMLGFKEWIWESEK